MKWLSRGWVSSYFLICELRLLSWLEMPKCISYMLRNGSWLLRLWTKQLTKSIWKFKENVHYYVTHFFKSRISEAKMSLLHKHLSEQNLSQFHFFYKTVFASSTSPGNWLTLKNKCVGIIQQPQNSCSSRLHIKAIDVRMFQNILLPFVLSRFQCICERNI